MAVQFGQASAVGVQVAYSSSISVASVANSLSLGRRTVEPWAESEHAATRIGSIAQQW